MKTTRTLIIAAVGSLLTAPMLLADVDIDAQLRITPRPRGDLEVYVWPDRGEGGVYYPGDPIYVNVEVNRDCFLVLYNIDTRGRLNILFPADPWQDNFVRRSDIIQFPRPHDNFDWNVEGPDGTEYVQAIASEVPIGLPEWPVYQRSVSGGYYPAELNNFYASSDRIGYIDVVNRNITGRFYDWCATDVASFYVRPRQRYYNVNVVDPWPDVFYGEIHIGWPIGARIYVDNIYIGIAPCYIPRRYAGRRVITCYDGQRLIRRHEVNCFPKRDYYVHNRRYGLRELVYKKGRWDADDHFRYERDSGNRNRYRVYDRGDSRYDDDDNDDGNWSQRGSNKVRIDNDRGRSNKESSAKVKVQGRDESFTIKRGQSSSKSNSRVEVGQVNRESSKKARVQGRDDSFTIKRGTGSAKASPRIEAGRAKQGSVSKSRGRGNTESGVIQRQESAGKSSARVEVGRAKRESSAQAKVNGRNDSSAMKRSGASSKTKIESSGKRQSSGASTARVGRDNGEGRTKAKARTSEQSEGSKKKGKRSK